MSVLGKLVRSGPLKGHKRTHAPQQTAALFGQLVVAGKHGLRNNKPERLGGLEVDPQLVLGRRLHRLVGRLFSLEDGST